MEDAVRQRVKQVLEFKGITLNAISKAMGYPQSNLNKQINSTTSISLRTVLVILDYAKNISAEWLLRGEGEMEKPTSPNLEIIESLKAENNMLRGENQVLREQLGLGERKSSHWQECVIIDFLTKK